MFKRIATASLLAFAMVGGYANAADGPVRYTGIGIGQVTVSLDDVDFDENDTGYKLFGGYMFNKNFGLEVAYMDGATAEMSGGGASVEISPDAFTIEGIGRIPLGASAAVFGKVGVAFYNADVRARIGTFSVSGSDSGNDIIYGLGFSIDAGQHFEIRAEWEQFSFDVDNLSGDASMITLGGIYKF